MAGPTPSGCTPCTALVLTLASVGLGHWLRQEEGPRHHMTTAAAIRWRHSAPDDQIAALREQMREIDVAGQVAWVDVLRDGQVAVYHAAHGMIPRGLPRPT
jgi:hypothetical protein